MESAHSVQVHLCDAMHVTQFELYVFRISTVCMHYHAKTRTGGTGNSHPGQSCHSCPDGMYPDSQGVCATCTPIANCLAVVCSSASVSHCKLAAPGSRVITHPNAHTSDTVVKTASPTVPTGSPTFPTLSPTRTTSAPTAFPCSTCPSGLYASRRCNRVLKTDTVCSACVSCGLGFKVDTACTSFQNTVCSRCPIGK